VFGLSEIALILDGAEIVFDIVIRITINFNISQYLLAEFVYELFLEDKNIRNISILEQQGHRILGCCHV
jgi:hypothetical protein